MSARDKAAEVLADAFDEWMLRMHGIHSSCNHKVEAEAMTDRLIANALLVTDEQREVYNDLRARIERIEALAIEWASAIEPDGTPSLAPVRDMAAWLRGALDGGAR